MQRRSICRALFLLLCVAPTFVIAGWTASRALPIGEDARLAWLGERLGLRIQCDRVTTPRPGAARFEGVSLQDPESGEEIARCDRLDMANDRGVHRLLGTELVLHAERLPLASKSLDRLLRSQDGAAVRLRLDSLRLAGVGHPARTWREVRATLEPRGPEGAAGRELLVESGQTRLVVSRNRQKQPGATRVAFESGPTGVRWGLLKDFKTPLEGLSGEVLFCGRLTTTLCGEERAGELTGEFRFNSAACLHGAEAVGLRLQGPLQVRVDSMVWVGERIESLSASVVAGPGSAERGLVFAAHHHLRCGPGAILQQEWADSAGGAIGFDELAFEVELDASGLKIRGSCRDGDGGVMPCLLARAREPLLYHPAEERAPVAALLRFAAPPDAPLRPTGTAVEGVARRLPIEQKRAPQRR